MLLLSEIYDKCAQKTSVICLILSFSFLLFLLRSALNAFLLNEKIFEIFDFRHLVGEDIIIV